MNPAQVKSRIEKRLRDYARQSIPIEKSHTDATPKLTEFFANSETALLQDPYLELLPRYKRGQTLEDLIQSRLIDEVTGEIFAEYFGSKGKPQRVTLHSHQVDAVRQSCCHSQIVDDGFRGDGNLVVCSGTGSGKTESFLIPVIYYLVRQWREETGGDRSKMLSGGVRAMVLYPMNALVNDQLARIRRILKNYPFLTFGRYTGETEQSSEVNPDVLDNLDALKCAFHSASGEQGEEIDGIIRNEIVSRVQWALAPAHILITNYSMLEYLLIRPETNFLFANGWGDKWKHIVIDEAHTYDGALGAEIGWLMRRLEARLPNSSSLRFIATSATLINKTELTDEEKENEIRSNFASRIFPAPPETFRVLFGAQRDIESGKTRRAPGFYRDLVETTVSKDVKDQILHTLGDTSPEVLGSSDDWARLIDLSISVKGASNWCQKTIAAFDRLPADNERPIPISSAVKLLQAGFSIASSKPCLIPKSIECDGLQANFFDGVSSCRAFATLGTLLVYGIGKFTDYDLWRDWMHDDADPRPSCRENDIDNQGKRKRIGNKLHFLYDEWLPAFGAAADGSYNPQAPNAQDLSQLSLQGIQWLLETSHDLAVSIDQEANLADIELRPERLEVQFSARAYQTLSKLKNWLDEVHRKVQESERILADAWRASVPNLPQTPAELNKPSEVLAYWLREDEALCRLLCRLSEALSDSEAANDARWSPVRDLIFSSETQCDRDDELQALLRLASFAQDQASREPLVDLRYHQLFRGLSGAGLELVASSNGEVRDWRLVKSSEDSGELGACRSCGQMFLLAYSSECNASNFLNGAESTQQLCRFAGGSYQSLWALAWKAGERDEVECQTDREPAALDLWFHPVDFKVAKAAAIPGEGWVRLVWLKSPQNKSYPRFLEECPNCRETRTIRQGRFTKDSFGLITPYTLTSILRVVALEELSRHADPSLDPVARLLPGEGRKLIAFSDSRSGAARLALSFQNFWIECALAKLLPEITDDVQDPSQVAAACDKYSHTSGIVPPHLAAILPKETQAELLRAKSRNPDFEAFCCLLAGKLEQNQAGRALEISGANGDDLDPKWAAGVLILEALRRVGRNSTIVRGGLGLSLCDFDYDHQQFPFPVDEVKRLVSEALFNLYKKANVSIPGEIPWDPDTINAPTEWGGDRVFVVREGARFGEMNFVTGDTGELNKEISRTLLRETEAWEPRLRQALASPEPSLHSTVAAFCATSSALNTGALRQLLVGARFIRQSDHAKWADEMLAVGFAVNDGEQTRRQEFKSLLRNHIIALVKDNILNTIWTQFVPGPNANGPQALIADQGGRYLLDPRPLQLIRLPSAPTNDSERLFEREYRNQCERSLIYIRAEEHTAQLSSRAGSAYQRAFADGHINLLSCSTTFEMGVDLGDLSVVFLGNLPPTPANYRQRAGRAGRRPGYPAYVMTYFGDARHDQYFWKQPSELFFGKLRAPVIHLDNPVIRARHLRAEGLHHFLKVANPPSRVAFVTPDGNVSARARGWQTLQDFMLGEVPGRIIKSDDALFDAQQRGAVHYKGKFSDSLVGESLVAWHQANAEALQSHILSIKGVPQDLEYAVASDLVWQLRGIQQEGFTPYPLTSHNLPKFQRLGGPHVPEFDGEGRLLPNDPVGGRRRWRWMPLEDQALFIFKHRAATGYYPVDPAQPRLTAFQRNFLKEKTLEWLAATRLLPKYGFPVDVVELRTKRDDPYARRIEFQRDLKIGLYEYALDEQVVADKRVYASLGPANYSAAGPGKLVLSPEYYCEFCAEFFPRHAVQLTCRQCGGTLKAETLCNPDYFKAGRSRAGRMSQKPAPAREHRFTGGIHNERPVAETLLNTAESRSGYITYLNAGPLGAGYPDPNNANGSYTLRHEVRTDIALWFPQPQLFTRLWNWSDERLSDGMKSALQGILRALVRFKRLKVDDVAGLVSADPTNRQQGARFGFVLFDNSSGGAGSVQDLVLTGLDDENDRQRRDTIIQILKEAIEVCECTCHSELNEGKDRSLPPLARENFLAQMNPDDKAGSRVKEACYDCLKSYTNQREHTAFDRHDAKRILKLLLSASGNDDNSFVDNGLPLIALDRLPADLPDDGSFYLSGGGGAANRPLLCRIVTPEETIVAGRYVLRRLDGTCFLAWVNPNMRNITYISQSRETGTIDRHQMAAVVFQNNG
jgi:hypothetical protein